MTDVLDTIERELVAAIRRHNARRRRRRTLGIFSGAVFAIGVTTAGVAGVYPSPIDQLLGGEADRGFALADGAKPSRLSLADGRGERWSVVLYRTADDWIVLAALPRELGGRVPGAVGRNPLATAVDTIDGPLISIGPVAATRDGRTGWLLVGQVDGAARELTVEVGGRRLRAELTPGLLRAPIERPPEEQILPQGEELLRRVGDALELRAFAVALPPGTIPRGTRTLDVTVETTLADGTVARERATRLCVSSRCGFTPYKLPDQDG
jgi:hypothetical protein